ncbi:MAG TPA: ribonuclease III [Candidatus Acidoferrales bacterium]|nr:ribonuclease III [Candidatus Acidoferrales bacterium]
MSDLAEFQQRLECQFRDEKLLRLALTHPSIAHEQDNSTPHNQRLEFLGDAILGAVLSQQLYEKFSDADEGLLTKSRAKLVNAVSLAAHGRALGLGAYLILSRGEENTGGRTRPSILADAFEALLGAIFLDGGFAAARDFILREFSPDFTELPLPAGIDNPKGELQEFLQAKSTEPPVYETISAVGPDHDRDFVCAVLHEGVELARGSGKSKKAAESEAATAALQKLREPQPS